MLECSIDKKHCVIGLEGVSRGDCTECLLVAGDKLFILRIVQIRRPVSTAEKANGGILLRWQRRLINRERRQKHGLVGKPGLPELLDEINAHATWQEHIDRPWAGGGDLRQLGRIINLAEGNVDLAGNLPFVEALKAGECAAARWLVR